MSRVHIIGAGLAGLSAAITASGAGLPVTVHEATAAGGGRCRSYFDTELGIRIDNGNHLLLSGNTSAFAYIDAIGARDRMTGPKDPIFPFMDLRTGRYWSLRPNKGRVPWWLLFPWRRVPRTSAREYLALRGLGREWDDTVVAETMRHGTFYWLLMEPLSIAALNTRPHAGLACLFGAVMRETLLTGGKACLPRVPKEGLSDALIDPAVETLRRRGADIVFNQRVTAVTVENGRATALETSNGLIALDPGDHVILAVPPWIAEELIPTLTVPNDFESILNIHYKIAVTPKGDVAKAGFAGLLNATAEWIFIKPDHVSITISAANKLIGRGAADLAAMVWPNVVDALDLEGEDTMTMPPFRVIKERRATIIANAAQEERRPAATTAIANLTLAGDWTDTRLPATIEGAVRSGVIAARLIFDPPKSRERRRERKKNASTGR